MMSVMPFPAERSQMTAGRLRELWGEKAPVRPRQPERVNTAEHVLYESSGRICSLYPPGCPLAPKGVGIMPLRGYRMISRLRRHLHASHGGLRLAGVFLKADPTHS